MFKLTACALGAAFIVANVKAQTSGGCGSSPPSQPRSGSTSVRTLTVNGKSRTYRLHRSSSYNQNTASALVFSFHGWGMSSSYNEGYMGLTRLSDDNGFLAVYPEGRSDYNRENNNGWASFNAVGTSDTKGGECTSSTSGYCYQSCAARSGGCGKCDWTTCENDSDFVAAILDDLESEYCINTDKIFATGYSNGGQMAYELGLTLTSRFAALVPGGGQPHVGHNDAPDTRAGGLISIMDLHGTRDTTCPGNTTTSREGWNYEPVDNVMRVWADANGCTGTRTTTKYDTPEDGQTQLYCVSFGNCPSGVDVVRCSYNEAHNWLGYSNNGGSGARLAWWFMDSHPKISSQVSKLAINVTLA